MPEGGPFPEIQVDSWVTEVNKAEFDQQNLEVVEIVFPGIQREELLEVIDSYKGIAGMDLHDRLVSEFGSAEQLHDVENRLAQAQTVGEQYEIVQKLTLPQKTGLFIFLRIRQRAQETQQ
jgi:hypothetical protein